MTASRSWPPGPAPHRCSVRSQPARRGKVLLRVPADPFTADDHHLQLLSFRDEELRGPAVSDIVGGAMAVDATGPSRLQDGEEAPWPR